MNLDEAKEILKGTDRNELRDHSFGDCEVTWTKGDVTVADGYFSRSKANVSVCYGDNRWFNFVGDDAHALRGEGHELIFRNDETGPNDYVEGRVAPGLSLEDVHRELTNPPDFVEELKRMIDPPEGAA